MVVLIRLNTDDVETAIQTIDKILDEYDDN